jgi:DHA2 family multidrug resistance protein-like MFS transporter
MGYASAFNAAIADSPNASSISSSVQSTLTKSYASATELAQQYPQYQDQIVAAAKQSFVDGQDWAYLAGVIAVLLGGALVFFLFPKDDEEKELLASYAATDAAAGAGAAS